MVDWDHCNSFLCGEDCQLRLSWQYAGNLLKVLDEKSHCPEQS